MASVLPKLLQRSPQLEHRAGVPATLHRGGEIIQAGHVAEIDTSHADRVECVHCETVVPRRVGEVERLAREIGALCVCGMGNDDVSCVAGDRSRSRRGQGVPQRASSIARRSGVVGA